MAEHSGSDVIKIETPSKPTLKLLEDNAVEVKWITPKTSGTRIREFEIAYKESTKKHHRTVNKTAGENITVIHRLKQNMKYEFKLRALNYEDDESSEWSEKTEILIDENFGYDECSSGEEEYFEPALEIRETDDVKDTNGVDYTADSALIRNEILYDRKRNTQPEEMKEIHVDNVSILNDEDDFSIDDTIPSKPICRDKNDSHSLTLVWRKPSAYKMKIDCYDIFCKEGKDKPYRVQTEDANIIYTVRNLKQNCSYIFRVRAVTKTDYGDKFGELSEESEPTTTNVSIASVLTRDESTREVKRDDHTKMVLCKLKCFKEGKNDTQNKIRHVIVGSGRDLGDGVDKRYVLLYGKTGSGKSTFIDLIVNHVYDVGWEDNFRLTAIDKMPDEMNRDESMSQTQWITFYEIKRKENSMLPYDLVLIDTPGLETDKQDTRERARKKFKALFSSDRLPGLHAVCFVNQSHSGKLTSTENVLSETLAEIVGSGINMNIFIFATCADSTSPMIERLLRMICAGYFKCFKFNNSPFTNECQLSRSKDQQNDWEKGKIKIFEFFDILKDLNLSVSDSFIEDARICQTIRIEYYSILEEITNACVGLINILDRNVHYKTIKVQNHLRRYSTICNKCKRNCCSPCFASWVSKRICWNIYFVSGICVACPITCTMDDHEYGTCIYINAPSHQRQQIDTDTLTRKKVQLQTEGLQLSALLGRATKIQNELHRRTKLGVQYSDKDMIDFLIQEKTATQSLHWTLLVSIFEKCKIELSLPEEDRWKTLDDLLNNCE